MIKKLKHTKEQESEKAKDLSILLGLADLELKSFVFEAKLHFSSYKIEIHEVIGDILESIGFNKVSITRDGDTNNRMDAIIIDDVQSIPIEIKSPKEVEYVNIKSIRQALENKIVLLSRKFYPTTPDTTSLAIGFNYPAIRSGVYELIDDIEATYNIKIGIIDFEDLLTCFYNVIVLKKEFDLNKIYNLKGKFNDY